jgi:hypothetical protein
MTRPVDAMSGSHWCPCGTSSSCTGGSVQVTPSGEVRTNILLWPLASSWFQMTWTPLWSAVTCA